MRAFIARSGLLLLGAVVGLAVLSSSVKAPAAPVGEVPAAAQPWAWQPLPGAPAPVVGASLAKGEPMDAKAFPDRSLPFGRISVRLPERLPEKVLPGSVGGPVPESLKPEPERWMPEQ
jgi:hypothetical protein